MGILGQLSVPERMDRPFHSATWTLATLLAQKVGRILDMILTVSTKPPSGGPRPASGNHVAWPKPQHLGPLRPGLEDGKGPCLEQSPHLRLQRGRCSFGLTSKRDHEILVSSSRRCLRSTPDLFLPRPQHRAGVTLGSHCQFWLHQAFTPTLTRGIHCGLVYSLQHGTQGRAQGPSARGDKS